MYGHGVLLAMCKPACYVVICVAVAKMLPPPHGDVDMGMPPWTVEEAAGSLMAA